MGMMFESQALIYIKTRLNQEFAPNGLPPAKGLPYWQSGDDDAVEFRDALRGSTQKKAPALGSITLEYIDLLIPDSTDGNTPAPDPSSGKSYKRWIIFWKKFRKKHPNSYKVLIDKILEVLEGHEPNIVGLLFQAIETDNDGDVGTGYEDIDLPAGTFRRMTIVTKSWDKV